MPTRILSLHHLPIEHSFGMLLFNSNEKTAKHFSSVFNGTTQTSASFAFHAERPRESPPLSESHRTTGLHNGFSAHSMRATFITRALENGASLEDVQRDVGHADPTTTKLYDRRGHNPEKSASFFANY